MGKILFWVLIILGGLFLSRLLAHYAAQNRRGNSQTTKPTTKASAKNPTTSPPAETMVRCHHCGIHLPRSEAVLNEGQTWCSTEHARLGHK